MTKYSCDVGNVYPLGDTPNQLNTKQANWVDVLVVDGIVYDKESIRELVAQIEMLSRTMIRLDDWINRLPIPTQGACTQLIAIQQALDITPQQCLREIQAEAGRAGYIAGMNHCIDFLDSNYPSLGIEDCANDYVDELREGGEC